MANYRVSREREEAEMFKWINGCHGTSDMITVTV